VKKSVLALTLLVVAGALWVFTRGSAPNYVNFPPTAGEVWVAFGDSLTSGVGANAGQDYPSQLGRRLGVTIVNRGVPGNTSADALQRLGEVSALKPRVVLVCFGGNDSFQRVPLAQTVSNLSAIVDRLQADGAFVVLIGVRSASVFDEYDKAFKKLAREKRTLYVPNILKGVLGHPDLMSDQIHPNEAGYARITDRLEGILRPFLSKLRR
jgi:acyl-CoA thioesterase-1